MSPIHFFSFFNSNEIDMGITVFNVKTQYGAKGDGITDDISSIQNAINACSTSGGGIVYFPNGVYIIGGALQTDIGGINYNSQLYVPYKNFDDVSRTAITLLGETSPNFFQGNGIIPSMVNNSGAILKSTISGSGTEPSILGSNAISGFNLNQCNIYNISFQLTANGSNALTMGAINFRNAGLTIMEKITAFPHTINLEDSTEPTSGVSGIIMPQINDSSITTASHLNVGGFYSGIVLGEHTSLYDCDARVCFNGYLQEQNHHACYGSRLGSYWNVNDVTFIGARSSIKIDCLNVEWDNQGQWYDTVNTINDPSNFGYGTINYNIVEAGVGWNNAKFVKNGGTNLTTAIL